MCVCLGFMQVLKVHLVWAFIIMIMSNRVCKRLFYSNENEINITKLNELLLVAGGVCFYLSSQPDNECIDLCSRGAF